jgi:hypothetical protein
MAPRVLCHVNHYFGRSVDFTGGSTKGKEALRRQVVGECLAAIRALPNAEVHVRVCGIRDNALLPLDADYAHLQDPTQLVYESLHHMASHVGDYDYFINVEDDILVPAATWLNVLEFDRSCMVNEILHPNRMEVDETGFRYCVDLYGNPMWTHQVKRFQGHTLRVAVTPHSGILIMSREKLRYALREIDQSFRGIVFAKGMESALAHFHGPFSLYRAYDDLEFHHVTHLDRWKHAPAVVYRANPYRTFHDVSLSIRDFVPPAAGKMYRYSKRLIARLRRLFLKLQA